MVNISEVTTYFKEVSQSIKFQLSATVTFGVALVLVWLHAEELRTYITILFLFPLCMFIGTIIEKIIGWRKTQKEKKSAMMEKKLGLMGKHQFHYQYDVLWPDKDFSGLGWQVLVLETPETVFLREPVCLKCKTNLVTRTNKTCEGFYLECTDCKEKFEVDDIGLARSIAESSLQGEARRNPRKFFSGY